MVLEFIFGEEEEPPPPPPPPSKGAQLKAAVSGKITNIKETIEYRKKKRKTKKLFKGVGEEGEARSGPYQHDDYNVLPTQDTTPQVGENSYQHHDIDYWKTLNKPTAQPTDNMNTFKRSKSNTTKSKGGTSKKTPGTTPRQPYDTYNVRHTNTRKLSNGWETLEARDGNYDNTFKRRTYREPTAASRRRVASSTSSSSSSSSSDEGVGAGAEYYADKTSLYSRQIHPGAQTTAQQARYREQQDRDWERTNFGPNHYSHQRIKKTVAERVIAIAAGCSQAIAGLFNRIKMTVCYTCGLCYSSAGEVQ